MFPVVIVVPGHSRMALQGGAWYANPTYLPNHVGQAGSLAHRFRAMDRKSECGGAHDDMDVGGRAPKVGASGDAWSSCRGCARTAIPALRDDRQDVRMSRSTWTCKSDCTCIPYGSSLPRRSLRHPAFRGTHTSLCIVPALRDVPASLQAKKGALGEGAFPFVLIPVLNGLQRFTAMALRRSACCDSCQWSSSLFPAHWPDHRRSRTDHWLPGT
jgi:hypothetical protein